MLLTEFPLFPKFVPELRNKIWDFAIVTHIQDIAKQLPQRYYSSWAGRRGNAIAHSLPGKDIIQSPLIIHIEDPYNGLKLRFKEDEFETLVDCFPISAVCYETRVKVAEFCLLLAPHIELRYDRGGRWSVEAPKEGDKPVVLRSIHFDPQADILEHVFPQPTTLTVRPVAFKSAKHLVGMVSRFFGNKIQRLIISIVVSSSRNTENSYWPEYGAAPASIAAIYDQDPEADLATLWIAKDRKIDVSASFAKNQHNHSSETDPAIIYVTRDSRVLVPESFWQNEKQDKYAMTTHLLKMYDVLYASLESLPHLEHIELDLEVQGWNASEEVRLVTNWKKNYNIG